MGRFCLERNIGAIAKLLRLKIVCNLEYGRCTTAVTTLLLSYRNIHIYFYIYIYLNLNFMTSFCASMVSGIFR